MKLKLDKLEDTRWSAECATQSEEFLTTLYFFGLGRRAEKALSCLSLRSVNPVSFSIRSRFCQCLSSYKSLLK